MTFPTPEENLACDEALLDACEDGAGPETLRFWEPERHFVVLGYSNPLGSEVRLEACRSAGVPILRRLSGGGTVLQGPGVLNYSLVLRAASAPLRTISGTNKTVMERLRAALQPLLDGPVAAQGDTDLALAGLKFSGNAQRRRKNALLFHGTFLLGLDLSLVEKLLPLPRKQPAYRGGRGHREFLTNLPLGPTPIKGALVKAWEARKSAAPPPVERLRELARNRYADPAWTGRI